MPQRQTAEETLPTDDQEYEELLLNVVTRVLQILCEPDDDDAPAPEAMSL